MDLITLDSLLAYWGVNMVVVGVVVGLVYASTALAKQHFGLEGKLILLVSGGTSILWSVLILLPMNAKLSAVLSTAVASFIISSGGWQAFKDILEKGGEKFAGYKKNEPSTLTDVKPG